MLPIIKDVIKFTNVGRDVGILISSYAFIDWHVDEFVFAFDSSGSCWRLARIGQIDPLSYMIYIHCRVPENIGVRERWVFGDENKSSLLRRTPSEEILKNWNRKSTKLSTTYFDNAVIKWRRQLPVVHKDDFSNDLFFKKSRITKKAAVISTNRDWVAAAVSLDLYRIHILHNPQKTCLVAPPHLTPEQHFANLKLIDL